MLSSIGPTLIGGVLLTCASFGVAWSLEPSASGDHTRFIATPVGHVAGDEYWSDRFGLPSIDGVIQCAVEYQGALVVGGWIRQAGGVPVRNLARWDGTTWSDLGGGTDRTVTALAVFDGHLIVAGEFQWVGNVFARGAARWDGSSWSAMGEGLHDSLTNRSVVSVLKVQGDRLVAGGDFTHSGSVPLNHVATWDGLSWNSMGPGFNGSVLALADFQNTIYAGGTFSQSGATAAASLARWDGNSWVEVGGGVRTNTYGGSRGWVQALATYNNELIVGGTFERAGDQMVSNIASWNDSNWNAMQGGSVSGIASISVGDGRLYAAGWSQLRSWDGAAWTPRPGLYGTVHTLVGTSAGLYAAGFIEAYDNTGNALAMSIARYSDGVWHSLERWNDRMRGLSAGMNGVGAVGSLTSHRDHVVAVGWFHFVGDPPGWTTVQGDGFGSIAEWDGERWRNLPDLPAYGQALQALSRNDTLYVGGNYSSGDSVLPRFPVYYLDEDHWTPLGPAEFDFSCMGFVQGGLYAAGYVATDPFITRSGVYHYSGGEWNAVGFATGGNSPPLITCIAEVNGQLVIGGRFREVDGIQANNLATWDGSRWKQFGGGQLPSEEVMTGLAVHKGSLIATQGLQIPGIEPGRVLRWSGSTWDVIGDLNGYLGVPASVGGELFVGGYLSLPSEPGREFTVARWDGERWLELGSGTNAHVGAFLEHKGSFYFGGGFSWAGGKSSFGIARWDDPKNPTPASYALRASPNPFTSSTSIAYGLRAAGHVRISVCNVHGREVALLQNGNQIPGTYSVSWNGRADSGHRLSAGVYFIRISLPGAIESRKVVLFH